MSSAPHKTQNLADIIFNPAWKPNTRIAAAWLMTNGRSYGELREIGGKTQPVKVVEGKKSEDIANRLGMNPKTFLNAVEELHGAGIIYRDVVLTKSKIEGGHPYKNNVYYIPTNGIELKPVGESRNNVKARATAKGVREKLNQLLERLACPQCGEVGCLHANVEAVCDHCKTTVPAEEIDALLAERKQAEKAKRKAEKLAHPAKVAHRNLNVVRNGISDPDETAAILAADDEGPDFPPPDLEALANETPLGPTVNFTVHSGSTVKFTVQEGNTEIYSNSPVPSSTVEPLKLSVSSPNDLGVLKGIDERQIISGEATLRYIESQFPGTQFTKVRRPGETLYDGTLAKGKEGIGRDYLDKTVGVEEAVAHLKRGGNVGLHDPRVGAFDIDYQAPLFISDGAGALDDLPCSFRRDDLQRCKLILRVEDEVRSKPYTLEAEDSVDGLKRKAEVIGRRKHFVVAGTHEGGALIEMMKGNLSFPFEGQWLHDWAEVWVEEKRKPVEPKPQPQPQRRSTLSNASNPLDLVPDAIAWWCAQSEKIAVVDRLIASCPRNGDHISVRPDDDTPSVLIIHDDYEDKRRSYHDFGTGETYDDYELYCKLTPGVDKRTHKWHVVDEYLISKGKEPRYSDLKVRA